MARGEELTDEQWVVLAPLVPEPPAARNARLQNFRRVATHFDYHIENFLGFVHLGCIRILLRHYL
jgi:transposase